MRKLAWAAGSFSAAVFLACLLPRDRLWLWALILAACAVALGLTLRGDGRRSALLAALCVALGLLWTQAHYALFITPTLSLAEQTRTVTVRVTDYPRHYAGYTLVPARLATAGLPRAGVSLYEYDGACDAMEPGDEFEAEIRFRSGMQRYGEEIWNYAAKGVYLTGTVRGAPRVTGRWAYGFLYFPKTLAQRVKALVRRDFPADTAPLMTALLTGDKALLYGDTRLSAAMRDAGLMHIVAVSGMHVSFLVGFVQLLFRKKRRAAAVCIPLLLLFMPMAGGTPSVLRAGFMQILLLLAPLLGRENDRPTSLCAVLALLLAVNPQSAHSASLLLSFASMAGILLISPRVYGGLTARAQARGLFRHKLPSAVLRYLIANLSVSLGALAFTTPIAAFSMGCVSLVSPLTNLLCLWVVSVCFPLGFLACILGAAVPALGAAAAWLVSWGLRYVILVVEWLGAWRFAAVYTANPRIAAWLVSVYIIIALCWYFRGKRGFRILPTMIGTVSLLLCAALLMAFADSRRALRFTALDVEQGQCLVLQIGGGVMLIDCGGPSSADAGTRAADYVESRFLKGVDVLLRTHLHSDHANGAEKLLWRVPVRLLLLPADAEDDDALLPGILAAAAARGTEVRFLSADQALSLGALHAELYVPQGGAGDNERGLIVSGHCGEYDFLVTGDAGIQTENQLLRRAELPREELLVVGHHGSRNSTGDALLRRTRPVNAVISVGGNSYGHPTQEVLDRLAACGTAVWRTDRSGNVTFSLLK